MKKLLGLLLNCVALCLCSAIGIGAGMYWMQNTQQNSAPTPVIQQATATVAQPVQQAPGLLNPLEKKPITQDANVLKENIEIQQVSLLYEETDKYLVEISQDAPNTGLVPIKINESAERKGPSLTLKVTIKNFDSKADALQLKLNEEEIKPTKTPQENAPFFYEYTITKTGTYELSSINLDSYKFTINNAVQGQAAPPVITSLSDTTSPEIVYPSLTVSSTNLNVFGIPCYLLRGSDFSFKVSKEVDRNVELEYRNINSAPDGKDDFKPFKVTPTTSPDKKVLTFTLSQLPPGVYQFRAKDTWFSEPSKGISNVVTIAVPQPDAINPLKPSLTSYKNQLYSNALTVTADPIQVFGGYLVLKGKNANPKQPLTFKMFYTKDGHLAPIDPNNFEVTYQADQTGDWNATLKLGDTLTGTRTLYIIRQNEDQFAFSDSIPINLNLAKLPSNPAELTQFEIDQSGKPTKLSDDLKVYINTFSPVIKAKESTVANTQYLLYTDKADAPFGYGNYKDQLTAKIITPLTDGQYTIHVRLSQGDQISAKPKESFTLTIQKNGFEVVDVQPPNFGTAPRADKLKIQFSEKNPLSDKDFTLPGTVNLALNSFQLIPSTGTNNFLVGTAIDPTKGEYHLDDNSITLTFEKLPTNLYQLVIKGNHLTDIFGNRLEGIKGKPGTNYTRVLNKPSSGSSDTEETDSSPSKFIEYHDYEKRDPPENGFNPSDKVVTRVARLYYYRDAHRVAQILNSEVKSLNQKGYNEAQITADRARATYEATTKKRRIQEKKTIQAAKDLRGAENDYRTQQQILSGLVRERAQLDPKKDPDKEEKLEEAITAAQGQITSLRSEITRLSGLMNDEDAKLQDLTIDEENQSAELFRRELQAEKTDLYTIGNGHPESYDAVRQVTIKVIGEGLIHLRGPIKGVNLIRIMINQIDSPVGQVRIAMHTIQINGEDGKRMEIVADRIQKSIDQSRFLTVQSSQMLRKAIVSVASEVANSTCPNGIAMSQEERDLKYLHAFFGQDFIEALKAMDSEFLQSGNKLLSIHSMDTTSLSSALFVLALAKNEIRQQILAQFYASIETELPEAECQFLFQGGPTKQTKHKHKLNLLAPYAYFQSFKGFFDHEVMGTDTMTPIQREFLRLAQIFKARLTTEREYKLHVMERAVIEQDEGNYKKNLEKARQDKEIAQKALTEVQKSIQKSQIESIKTITGLQERVSQTGKQFENITSNFASFQKTFDELVNEILTTALGGNENINISYLPTKTRSDLLFELFPVQVNDKTPDFDDRIDFVLKKYYPTEYKQYETTLGDNSSDSTDNGHAKPTTVSVTIRTQIQKNLTKKYKRSSKAEETTPKDSIRSKSEGKFTYGNEEFHFYFADKEFILGSDREYDLLNRITRDYITQSRETMKKLKWFEQNLDMKRKLQKAEELQSKISPSRKEALRDIHRLAYSYALIQQVSQHTADEARKIFSELQEVNDSLSKAGTDSNEIQNVLLKWREVSNKVFSLLKQGNELYRDAMTLFQAANNAFNKLIESGLNLRIAERNAQNSQQELDHKKFLDMQIDETEDKFIDLLEGTRAHTANIDNYLKLIATALEDDFNTQFYYPAFKEARDASRFWNVTFGSMETSSILTNNRSLGKVAPKATIEFDLPKRQLAIIEGMNIAEAAVKEYGALVNDPTFLAITSMNGGENVQGGFTIEPDSLEKQMLGQPGSQGQRFGSAFENLIPDPAVFKFETGTGFTVRPVIQPDGQAVVFDLNYLYRTNVREPVRADEKHLGRIKEHFIDTDVQLGNYELREISRFVIALKASRTGNGVPLLSDVPGVGVLFRPTPSAESSLQQSQIMSQAVIYPTLFDLMGLRWAPAVADVGPLQLTEREFISKGRDRFLKNRVYDYAGSQVDKFLQIPDTERRGDLYRTQQSIPDVHPNGYMGPGLNLKRSTLEENYDTERMNPQEQFIPGRNSGGAIDRDQAVPMIPPAEQGQLPPLPFGTRSSAVPVRDSNIKPAGWNPTETETPRRTSGHQNQNAIFSPRRVSSQTEPARVSPKPASAKVNTVRSNQVSRQQSEVKQKSFYKRSASRLKSIFYKK